MNSNQSQQAAACGATNCADESTNTANMRVSRIEQAMKTWHIADERADDFQAGVVSEYAVVVMLADIRHYCDAHGLSFGQLDRDAHAEYLEQLEMPQNIVDEPSLSN